MRISYLRIPLEGQPEQHLIQERGEDQFDAIFLDKCPATTHLWERTKGREVRRLLAAGVLKELHIPSIVMLGHDVSSILQVWKELTESRVKVSCTSPDFQNVDEDGKLGASSELLLSILTAIAEFQGIIRNEEEQILRRKQQAGVQRAKAQGKYKGRKKGTTENINKFLSKPKVLEILNDLAQGLSVREISDLRGCSNSTVFKVIKLDKERRLTIGKVISMITEIQDPNWIDTLSDEDKEKFLQWEWFIMERLKLSKNSELLSSLPKLQDALSGIKELEQITTVHGIGGKKKRSPATVYRTMIGVLPKGVSKFTTRRRNPVRKSDELLLELMARYFGESKTRCTEYYEILKELGKLGEFKKFILALYGMGTV